MIHHDTIHEMVATCCNRQAGLWTQPPGPSVDLSFRGWMVVSSWHVGCTKSSRFHECQTSNLALSRWPFVNVNWVRQSADCTRPAENGLLSLETLGCYLRFWLLPAVAASVMIAEARWICPLLENTLETPKGGKEHNGSQWHTMGKCSLYLWTLAVFDGIPIPFVKNRIRGRNYQDVPPLLHVVYLRIWHTHTHPSYTDTCICIYNYIYIYCNMYTCNYAHAIRIASIAEYR